MARNLARENKDRQEAEAQAAPTPSTPPAAADEKVSVITFEALIANNLDVVMKRQEEMMATMKEGFKQVGVVFPEKQ